MIFYERRERIKKNIALALTVIAVILCIARTETHDADRSMPLAPATGSAVVAESAAPAKTSSAALVDYTKGNYPELKNISYGTFVKLDYQEVEDRYTYFYDFRKDWRAGAKRLREADTSLWRDTFGYFGIIATADKNVVTCTLYTELDNATLKAVQFRTYDDAKKETIQVAEDGSAKFSVKSLPNGPYTLCVWFDYTLKAGRGRLDFNIAPMQDRCSS